MTPALWHGLGFALLLTVTAQTRQDYRELDSWDEPNGWGTYLDAHYVGGRLQTEIIDVCESVYFMDDQQSISIVQVGEDNTPSHPNADLRVDDPDNYQISETRTFIVKVDGVTIAKLLPFTTGITGRVEAEISRLDDFVKKRGRRLQVVTDNDVYEANARFLPDVVRDLRACERERDKRLHANWKDEDYATVHPRSRPRG